MEVLSVIILFVAFTDVITVFKTKQIGCPNYSTQLANLFSVMCSNIANGTNNTLRDACIGCFQSASNMNNQPSVVAIVDCATTYLVNTNYSTCFNLPNIPVVPTTTAVPTTTPGIDPRLKRSLKTISLNCDTGYCGYIRCIRGINANILIAGCYAEARIGNNATYPNQQVILYKNITACILAKSRCSTMNPITGQTQNGRYTTQIQNKFGLTSTTTYYYTLQIASNGELRIIGLPNTVSVQQDFCSTQSNLMEATWNNFVC